MILPCLALTAAVHGWRPAQGAELAGYNSERHKRPRRIWLPLLMLPGPSAKVHAKPLADFFFSWPRRKPARFVFGV